LKEGEEFDKIVEEYYKEIGIYDKVKREEELAEQFVDKLWEATNGDIDLIKVAFTWIITFYWHYKPQVLEELRKFLKEECNSDG